jgi:hypothetical protein
VTAVFQRMVAAMSDNRFSWRTVERVALEAGVTEARRTTFSPPMRVT